jgi:predicted DNA-binding transcriptional regulator AlpA
MDVRTTERLKLPEVARRVGLSGEEIYEKIFSGELEGRPGSDGAVYVTTEVLTAYQRRPGRRSIRA